MAGPVPVIYLLHGENEFGISRFIADLERRLGDSTATALNSSRFEGQTLSLEELRSAVMSIPILAHRRLVVVYHSQERFKQPVLRSKYLALLEKIPASTALILVEDEGKESKRRKSEPDWLLKWATSQATSGRVFLRHFPALKTGELANWIQEQAKAGGGQFTPNAAALLASLVGEDTRLAYQEILKLLAFVNYNRTVEPQDVEQLTIAVSQGDIFAMVDALGNKDGRRALRLLSQLLEQSEASGIFGMIVRQFRLLILVRDILDRGGGEAEITRQLNLAPFVTGKLTAQARHFTMTALEKIYRHLLEVDRAVKSGRTEMDTALDTFAAGFMPHSTH